MGVPTALRLILTLWLALATPVAAGDTDREFKAWAAQEGERPATRALWNWSGRVFVVCQPRLDPWRLMPPLWPVALNGRPMVQNPLPRILRRAKDFCFTGCCAACFMNRGADEDVCDCCGCVMATRIRSMM